MDAYFSDNSDIPWILATGTVLFTPLLDESDAILDYDFQDDDHQNDKDDKVHPSADLYEIYERSQKLVTKTKNRTLHVVLSRISETELKYIKETKENLDTYLSAISSDKVKNCEDKVSHNVRPSTSGR